MTQTSFRDIEQISALLDEKLNLADAARLQKRIEADPELRAVYEDLRQARALLRRLPQRRAPRNFTLKPSAARVRPPLPRLFPTFRLASALASLLLFFSLATNATLPRLAGMANSAPMYAYGMGGAPESDRAMGGGGGEDAQLPIGGGLDEPAAEAPAAMEAPVEEAAPAAEEPSAKTAEPTAAATQLDAEPTLEAVAALPPVEEPQPVQEEPLPVPEPPVATALIPTWALVLLALLAIASGTIAFWLRWQSDRQWKTKASPKK